MWVCAVKAVLPVTPDLVKLPVTVNVNTVLFGSFESCPWACRIPAFWSILRLCRWWCWWCLLLLNWLHYLHLDGKVAPSWQWRLNKTASCSFSWLTTHEWYQDAFNTRNGLGTDEGGRARLPSVIQSPYSNAVAFFSQPAVHSHQPTTTGTHCGST